MKKKIINKIKSIKWAQHLKSRRLFLSSVFSKYAEFTMVQEELYINNLLLAEKFAYLKGDIVECGVWRGGMIAGIAEVMGKERNYFLFDSFQGLPSAREIDGESALQWQTNTHGDFYFNNCSAEVSFAETAMKKTGVAYKCIPGWFEETVPVFNNANPIALLRLDGDWYDSTLICLKYLFPKVVKGGIIIIDDYYTWDGCCRAVHDYLSQTKSASRIYATEKNVCYILKMEE